MDDILETLRAQQRLLNTIADRTTRIELRLESMAHNLDRLGKESL